jgi:hypothetical protein
VAHLDAAEALEPGADCQTAYEPDPRNPRTAGRWGQLRVAQGRFAEAGPLLRTAVAGTGLAEWAGWLALALRGQGQVDEARAVLDAWWPAADAGDRARFTAWQARLQQPIDST